MFASFWQKICEPLDGYLWHKDITHHIVRAALRNEILACGAALLLGAVFYVVSPWIFWFGIGILCMTWIFWSWAKFFSRLPLGNYSAAFFRAVLLRFGARLIIIAFFLYFALALCSAPVSAILAGLAAGSILVLASYALALRA